MTPTPDPTPSAEHPDSIALRAWHTQFGTTQLSHATARLHAAENRAERAEAKLGEIKSVFEAASLACSCMEEGPDGYNHRPDCDTGKALAHINKLLDV